MKEFNLDTQPHNEDYWTGFKNALEILEDLGYCKAPMHPFNIKDCVLAKVNKLDKKKIRKTEGLENTQNINNKVTTIVSRYNTYISNIEWDIRTNEREGEILEGLLTRV